MRQFPVVTDVPAVLAREIGRVIVAFANLEYLLSRVVYALLGIGPKEGRLAVREQRATDRLVLIKDLIAVKRLIVEADMGLLAEALDSVSRQRNQLAHGVWVRDPDSKMLLLMLTKGSWEPVEGQKTKRVIKPEVMEYGVEDCRSLTRVIEATADRVKEVLDQVEDQAEQGPVQG